MFHSSGAHSLTSMIRKQSFVVFLLNAHQSLGKSACFEKCTPNIHTRKKFVVLFLVITPLV